MAKMFYTVEEVCQRLNKTQDEVHELVSSGQIQEFRDGEKLIFKVEQIDLLADPDDSGEIELNLPSDETLLPDGNLVENSGTASALGMGTGDQSAFDLDSPAASATGGSSASVGLDLTGSGTGLSSDPLAGSAIPPAAGGTGSGLAFDLSGSATGVSAFGGGGVEDAGETQLGEEFDDDLTLESVGSGSGLLDLTRESDDTSLGAELLEEVYSGEDEFELPANASGLFEAVTPEASEAAPTPAAVAGGSPMLMVEEAYDGAGSGLGVGLSIGAAIAMIGILVILASELQGTSSVLTDAIAGNLWLWTGGLAAGAIVAGGIGLFIGRASE